MPPNIPFFSSDKTWVPHSMTTSMSEDSRWSPDKQEFVDAETKVSSYDVLSIMC